MPSPLSNSALIESITNLQTDGTSKRHVKSVVEALATIGHKELKKSGVFVVPGFAKFMVVKKPATKAREGINPFTKEPSAHCLLRKIGSTRTFTLDPEGLPLALDASLPCDVCRRVHAPAYSGLNTRES
jgi:nucleoid DNA-binding protein